jgi:hypothetical protein
MSPQPVENAHDMAPPSACVSKHIWTHMNCARIYCRPKSTCKASAKHLAAAKTSALASLSIQCQTGQITLGSPLWRQGKPGAVERIYTWSSHFKLSNKTDYPIWCAHIYSNSLADLSVDDSQIVRIQCLHYKPVSNHFCSRGGRRVESISRGDCE